MTETADIKTFASPAWRNWVRSAPFLALVALELDQLTKLCVRETLALGESVPAEGSLRLTRAVNPGVVFGIPASPAVSLIVPLVVILTCLLIYWRFQKTNSTMLNIGIGLFVGGSLGNLIDRIVYGQVTDFIEVVLFGGEVALIFNLADLCVVLGLVMLEIFLMGVIIWTIRKRGLMYNPMGSLISSHITRGGSREE